MLSNIDIEKYRSIFDEFFPLAPLTVLVGSNGAGKSNVVKAISVVSELIRRYRQAGPEDADKPFATGPQYRNGWFYTSIIDSNEIYAYARSSRPRIRLVADAPSISPSEPAERVRFRFDIYDVGGDDPKVQYELRSASPFSMDAALASISGIRYIGTERLASWHERSRFSHEDEVPWISPSSLVSALRQIDSDVKGRRDFINTGKMLFDVDWGPMLEDPKSMEFVDRAIGPRGVPLAFDLGSLGMHQFFPVLVHCTQLVMQQRGILVTEEPEISLHPRAQVAVGEYFTRVAGRGVQLIITTHSHYLLQGICKKVRDGELAPGDVAILNCEKTRYGTKARRLLLDEQGRIEGWIPSFAEVDDYLFQQWVQAIPEVADADG